MADRKPPNLKEKLAAIILVHYEVPHEISINLSRGEILSLVDWDHHPVPFAVARDLGWHSDKYNHPSNLTPILTDDHAVKTAKRGDGERERWHRDRLRKSGRCRE